MVLRPLEAPSQLDDSRSLADRRLLDQSLLILWRRKLLDSDAGLVYLFNGKSFDFELYECHLQHVVR